MDQDRSDSAAPGDPGTPGNDADRRLMLVLAHILAVVATFALWAAADAWQSATGAPRVDKPNPSYDPKTAQVRGREARKGGKNST